MMPAQLLSGTVAVHADPAAQSLHFRHQSFSIEIGKVFVHLVF
jgi:hypothetical protein